MAKYAGRFNRGKKCFALVLDRGNHEDCSVLIRRHMASMCGQNCPFYKTPEELEEMRERARKRCEKRGFTFDETTGEGK